MVIPHQPIPIGTIRPNDILILLVLGSVVEIATRLLVRSSKSRSSAEKDTTEKLRALRYETAQKRNLGPSAFVETSKLERKVLTKAKELAAIEEIRTAKTASTAKLVRNIGLVVNVIVFLLYYGVPLFTIDGMRVAMNTGDDIGADPMDEEMEAVLAGSFMSGMFFPLSKIGLGMKLARLGIKNKASSMGALVVYWSARSMVGMVYECLEAVTAL